MASAMAQNLPLYDGPKKTPVFHRANGVARILAVLEAMNVDPWPHLADLGIDGRRLFEADYFLSMDQEFEVFSLAKRLSGCPSLGLACGWSYNFVSFGALGVALVTAASMRDGLEYVLRNIDLTYAYLEFDSHLENDTLCVTMNRPFDLGPHDVFILERDIAAAYRVLSDILGEPLPLLKVCFDVPAPNYAGEYRKIFNATVEFGSPFNRIEFSASLLERQPALRDQYAHNIAREQVAYLQKHTHPNPTTAQRVISLFLKEPSRYSRLESVADALHLSPRTLRRKLEHEGTTFSRLTHSLRYQLAVDYLTTDMGLNDIAARLGYSDGVNFSHAFKRWTDRTPSEYRKTALGP
jgi:AraC-like DNA-binding protein